MMFTSYGLLCALALLCTLLIAGWWCRRQQIGYGVWIRLGLTTVPLAWLGSRLLFCLANIPYFVETLGNPALMLNFWDGGASMMGALGGMILAAYLTARWQKVHPGGLLDAVALGAPAGLLIARLAEGTTHGMGLGRTIITEALIPLGVTEDLVHPVYLYEAAIAALILLGLFLWVCLSRKAHRPGDVLLTFLTLFGSAQVVLESLRDDSHMILIHFVRINQIIAIALPVIALVIWSIRALRSGTKKGPVIAAWLATAACITVGIVQEFAVDSSYHLLLDYAIMAAATAVIAVAALYVREK